MLTKEYNNKSKKGTIYLNHHELTAGDYERLTFSIDGNDLVIKPEAGIAFPEKELLPLHITTVNPKYNITGMRVCYGIVGNHPDTKIYKLQLAQHETTTLGLNVQQPIYGVKLENTTIAGLAPKPMQAGLSGNEDNEFTCVDSTSSQWQPCLDPSKGTIRADTGIHIGGPDSYIVIQSISLLYNSSCKSE